jgi:hypothetical protein
VVAVSQDGDGIEAVVRLLASGGEPDDDHRTRRGDRPGYLEGDPRRSPREPAVEVRGFYDSAGEGGPRLLLTRRAAAGRDEDANSALRRELAQIVEAETGDDDDRDLLFLPCRTGRDTCDERHERRQEEQSTHRRKVQFR